LYPTILVLMQVMRSSIFIISGDPIPSDFSEQPFLLSAGPAMAQGDLHH